MDRTDQCKVLYLPVAGRAPPGESCRTCCHWLADAGRLVQKHSWHPMPPQDPNRAALGSGKLGSCFLRTLDDGTPVRILPPWPEVRSGWGCRHHRRG